MNFEVLLQLIKKMHLYVSIFSKSVKNHKNFSQNQKVIEGQTLFDEKVCGFIMLALISNFDKIRFQTNKINKKNKDDLMCTSMTPEVICTT